MMRCDLCVIAKYCLGEPESWKFKSEKEALKVLDIMNHCLETNLLPKLAQKSSVNTVEISH